MMDGIHILHRFTAATVLFVASTVYAAPSQEDVFRSIQQNVDKPIDTSRLLPFLLAGVAVVIVAVVVSHRRTNKPARKSFNHPGKLLKEVTRDLPLRPAEIKQLKLLADAAKAREEPIESPLTLLLCPSQLVRHARQGAAKVDRKATASLLRKLGVQ